MYAPYLTPTPYTVSLQIGSEVYRGTFEVGEGDDREALKKETIRKLLEEAKII
jgi:hypothetical protein